MSDRIRRLSPDVGRLEGNRNIVCYRLPFDVLGSYAAPLREILCNGPGQKGVELFFGMSGLLITSRLLEEARSGGQISLRQFYIRRSLRILPPASPT